MHNFELTISSLNGTANMRPCDPNEAETHAPGHGLNQFYDKLTRRVWKCERGDHSDETEEKSIRLKDVLTS